MQKHAGCDRLCRSMAERDYPSLKLWGGETEMSYPTPEVRDGGREELHNA